MHSKIEIPKKTIYRLSIYQRCLERLKENAIETMSSQTLAKAAGVKPTQLRKDIAQFGQFGTRGLGYDVDTLTEAIGDVLGRNHLQPVILVGVGNLGTALLRYQGFNKEGFEITAAFDASAERIAQIERRHDLSVDLRHDSEMKAFIRKNGVKMAILTVPAVGAQSVANHLVEDGIQAILNFSPTVLEMPDDVVVNSVDLAVELENLSYFIR